MTRALVPQLTLTQSAQKQWQSLSTLGDLITPQSKNRQDFLEECRSGKLDGVIAAYRTFYSADITGLLDEELILALPKTWEYLAHCGAGYDQIDVKACSRRDPPLLVSNVPVAVDDATADTGLFLMLGALRNFNAPMGNLRRGEFRGSTAPPLGRDPEAKVLGILGMGGIGRNMARKARAAWGMTVIYHNRRQLDESLAEGAEYVSFDDLLRRSDVLSLNLPLNANTRHLLSTREFALMKPTAVLVNTARGAVVDEAALVHALDKGIIAGAGLDVFEDEPKIHPGLLSNERVMLLPHLGTYTFETLVRMIF
ncbi:hypothetical protein LTR84_003045 [Exophiala bonariae]|uniref:D-isomer specific 2-hydroxyacid dehydrogenase NAD-binding domain-containing protein n=1 Tax=Exophiala bonariae TaxID=1690606 RepID=A0AAV9N7J9_9EURO|nr:hypothetical protein LTR84_003045 [Exophiala bonariae]